jgi:hypothetical protein
VIAAMFVTAILFLAAASVQTDLIGMLSRARSLCGFLVVWVAAMMVVRGMKRLVA